MTFKKKFIVGKKLGMTQIVAESGEIIPVTVVRAYDNYIYRHKTIEKDGYSSVVVAYDSVNKNRINKPHLGQFSGDLYFKHFKEFRVESPLSFELQSVIDPSIFVCNRRYDVQSKTIGRGFTGAIKAWNHQRGPMSHGSKNHRLLGSIGQATTPGRVKKGKKMHTRYGNETVTAKNLELMKIDGQHLFFKGAIPGKMGTVFVTGVDE
jgi:large subunit ribosomal protein L3